MHPQEQTYNQLTGRFAEGHLPASLLLTGPRGVGKWSVAFELAKRITCLQPRQQRGCGECASCRQLEQFAHPDIQFLFPLPANAADWGNWIFPYLKGKLEHPFASSAADAKHFIPIEAIRQFQVQLARRATLSPYKVGVIYEAERMLPGTMDSLLKLLEEPPDKCFLLVVTPEPRFLLSTIVSRLQRVNVPALPDEFVSQHLQQAYTLRDDQLTAMVRFARGQLFDIDTIMQGDFMQMRQAAFEMITLALSHSQSEVYLRAGESAWLATREKVEALLRHWQSILRDLLICGPGAVNDDGAGLASRLVNYDYLDRYAALRDQFGSVERIETLSDRIEAIRQELRRNVNPRMAALSFLFLLSPPNSKVR